MKFGQLLEESMRPDWVAHYFNYKRGKEFASNRSDLVSFKEFITSECSKVERFYLAKLAEVKTDSDTLTKLMDAKGGNVAGMVKSSWKHTEDLRGLYDFCRINTEGVRKALKKYDKALKASGTNLQGTYLPAIKTEYSFFQYKDSLKDLLQECASFWNQDAASKKAGNKTPAELISSLPTSFPLAKQIEDQAKVVSEKGEDTEGEDSDEEHKDKTGEIEHEPDDVDSKFEKQYNKHRESKPEWKKLLADYQNLNAVLKKLASVSGKNLAMKAVTSLSMSEHPDSAYGASPEIVLDGKPFKEVDWFKAVEKEIDLVSKVTNEEIRRVRNNLAQLRTKVEQWHDEMADKSIEQSGARAKALLSRMGQLESDAKQLGSDFLALEKFVNLNYQAFEKLLKTHDKLMPATPCHQFYMAKLRNQEWIRSDFSDIFVALSDVHSMLRQDDSGVKNEDAKQDFVRNTKKYWVPVEYVSSVKHVILQHLPVFRMWQGGGDSQLVNSVYFDNRQMQLYHGRMDKTPGAIALRLRWYGTDLKTIYVERKTHLDSWTGNVSVKERFTLTENLVVPYLNSSYKVNEYADEMKRKGKKEADINAACKLFTQIQKAIESKQLGPTVRTQYMRTAFQIPFDSSVRISLDTNLAMVREDCCGYASTITERWRRDELAPLKACEHTHFPHAILEVKLQGDVENPPQWVRDLLDSGMCTEVYKFSKFIHGSAVLLTELVAAAPYWIDDISIRDSVNASAPTAANMAKMEYISEGGVSSKKKKPVVEGSDLASMTNGQPGDDEGAEHPLLGKMRPSKTVMGTKEQTDFLGVSAKKAAGGGKLPSAQADCFGLCPQGSSAMPRKVPVRVEPKTFFANERTFLAWLHMSVTLGSISSALSVFASDKGVHGASVQMMSLMLTMVAGLFVIYSMSMFYVRRQAIRRREDAGLDGAIVPILLAGTLVVALMGVFIANVAQSDSPVTPPETTHPAPHSTPVPTLAAAAAAALGLRQ